MYLSRLVFSPRSRQALHDLGDCHELHRTMMRAFPQAPADESGRAHAGLLFRIELERSPVVVLAQSRLAPDWSLLPAGYLLPGGVAVKEITGGLASLTAGMSLRFRLRANPTRAVLSPDGGVQQGRGKRVALLGSRAKGVSTEALCLDWLARKGVAGGFTLASVAARGGPEGEAVAVPDVRVALEDGLRGWRRDTALDGARRQLTLNTVLFEGRLTVTNGAALRETVAQGIGPGKAYGCGLLSLARM